MLQRIGKLELATATRFNGFDRSKHVRSEHVTADDGQVGRSFRRLWLLHHVPDAEQAILARVVRYRFRIHGAISGDSIARDFHQRYHGRAVEFVNVQRSEENTSEL